MEASFSPLPAAFRVPLTMSLTLLQCLWTISRALKEPLAKVPEDYAERLTELFAGGFWCLRLLALEVSDLVPAKLVRNSPALNRGHQSCTTHRRTLC